MKRLAMLSTALAGIAATALPVPGAARPMDRTPDAVRLPRPKGPVQVAFVVGPHGAVIDWAGPWEAFSDLMLTSGPGFEVAMVSDKTDPFPNATLTVTPKYTFANFPVQPNVIVIGAQQEHTPAKIAWIREAAKQADVVMSVCVGAFLLAETGLLDGLQATTHHNSYDTFEQQFPRVHLQRSGRFVDNGKFACSGGESAGIDLAFHVIRRYYGDAGVSAAADIMNVRSLEA